MRPLILTLLHPVVLVLLHAAWTRGARGRLSNQLTAVAAIVAAALATGGLEFFLECAHSSPRAGDLAYVALASSCIGYTYFHVFNMTETSRRVRLLSLLAEKGVDAVDPSSCSAEYNVEEILRIRLERLERLGQIRREGDRYVLCGRTLYAGWALINALRKLLKFA